MFQIGNDKYILGHYLIGVVTQFVPFMEPNSHLNLNSGYSIVEPMDSILDLIKQ